jgi:phosphatidate cytidylyltransferase
MHPEANPDFLRHLVAAVTGVLILASMVGWFLKARISPGRPHAVIDNLNIRIATWWLIALVFGAAISGETAGVSVLFAALSVQALREFVGPDRAWLAAFWVASLAAIAMQYLLAASSWHAAFVSVIPSLAALAIAMAMAWSWAASAASPLPWTRLGPGLLICVYGLSHVPALMALHRPGAALGNAGPVVFLVIVVQASDVLQYICGKLAGKQPIAPCLSPSKTVEGALGGLLGATALGTLLAPLTPFSAEAAAAVAFMLALLGILSGLMLSAIKRQRGIKDWGAAIPGHGGVLDRVDSLCLSAPVFYHLLRMQPSA